MREHGSATQGRSTRLFLDTGVIIAGCVHPWGAAKAVLILATQRGRFTVVLTGDIEKELQSVLDRQSRDSPARARALGTSLADRIARVRVERHPVVPSRELERFVPTLLPALRHGNDLAVVVSAVRARPDWVISENRTHWNDAVAARTGLRIVTPWEFLAQLSPRPEG